jgi:restriction system protein
MPNPDYQTLMRPVLEICNNQAKNTSGVVDELVGVFNLTQEDIEKLLPGGGVEIRNRTQWAFKYLHVAKLLDKPQRGFYQTSERGKRILEENKERVDISVLNQFEEFSSWRQGTRNEVTQEQVAQNETPDERLRNAYMALNTETKNDILKKLLECSPSFFEKLVLNILVAMGYGGSSEEVGEHTGKSGDGGIDGIINQDKLGLDKIYIQAKRWEANVGEPVLRNFVGSLTSRGAQKGIIFTTSNFSREAINYCDTVPQNIVLIDGNKLAELMMEFNVGVDTTENYKRHILDENFFDED